MPVIRVIASAPRHCERSAAIHVCGADQFVIARSESDAATRYARNDGIPAALRSQ